MIVRPVMWFSTAAPPTRSPLCFSIDRIIKSLEGRGVFHRLRARGFQSFECRLMIVKRLTNPLSESGPRIVRSSVPTWRHTAQQPWTSTSAPTPKPEMKSRNCMQSLYGLSADTDLTAQGKHISPSLRHVREVQMEQSQIRQKSAHIGFDSRANRRLTLHARKVRLPALRHDVRERHRKQSH